MAVVRFYDSSKNPDGGHIPGVPLRDLTEEEFSELPAWLQASVDASPMYRKTSPGEPHRAASKPEKET